MVPESELLRAVDRLLEAYREPAVMLHRPYPPTEFPKTRSRLGGLPLLPDQFRMAATWKNRGQSTGVHPQSETRIMGTVLKERTDVKTIACL